MMNDFQEKFSFKPTKLQFREISLETPGYFSYDNGSGTCESTETMDAMIENILDMEELIKKNFLMTIESPEKVKEFYDNNPVQATVREELQGARIEIDDLKRDNQQLKQSKFGHMGESEQNSEQNKEAKLKKALDDLEFAKYQISEKDKVIESLRTEKLQLKRGLKDFEEKANKYENNYIPKLKETKKF